MAGRRGRLIAIEGVSGSGKTTLTPALAEGLRGIPLYEAFDRLDRKIPLGFDSEKSLQSIEDQLLAEEIQRFREALVLIRRGSTVVADTGFLGPLTYCLGLTPEVPYATRVCRRLLEEARRAFNAGWLGVPDLVLILDVSESTAARRASGAPDHDEPFQARHLRVGRVEQALWRRSLSKVLNGRVRLLDARGDPEVVLAKAMRLIRACSEIPSTNASDGRAVLLTLDRAAAEGTPATVMSRGRRPRLPRR